MEKRYVSILGDSISTFERCNPDGFRVYYDEEKQRLNGLTNVSETWWYKVIQALDVSLCVNNSFSGSRVSGDCFPAANSPERLKYCRSGDVIPQLLLIYIGGNDFGYNVPLRSKRLFQRDTSYFGDAYDLMLSRIQKMFPQTTIVCSTGIRTYLQDDPSWQYPEFLYGKPREAYNDQIRWACHKHKVRLVDLSRTYIRYETLDGSHPTKTGHSQIASAWISELRKHGWLSR